MNFTLIWACELIVYIYFMFLLFQWPTFDHEILSLSYLSLSTFRVWDGKDESYKLNWTCSRRCGQKFSLLTNFTEMLIVLIM